MSFVQFTNNIYTVGSNVGIGKTNPSTILDINGTLTGNLIGSGASISGLNSSNISTGSLLVPRGGFGTNTLTSGAVLVGNGTGAIINPSNFIWDNTNTRLGIGKTNPNSTLDVNGTIIGTLFSGSGASITGLNSSNVNTGTLSVSYGGISNNTINSGSILIGNGTGSIITSTNFVWNNNNLGIGKTNPTTTLDVSGTITGIYSGSGASLSGLNTTNIVSGILSTSYGGTGLNTLTTNSFLLGNGTGSLISSSNLVWDNTNSRLGIGITIPLSVVHVKDAMIVERTNIINTKKTYKYSTQFGNILYSSNTANNIGYRIEWSNSGSRTQELLVSMRQYITGASVGYFQIEMLVDTSDNSTTMPGLFYELEKYTRQSLNVYNLSYSVSRFSTKGIELKTTWDCSANAISNIELDIVYPSELGSLTLTELATLISNEANGGTISIINGKKIHIFTTSSTFTITSSSLTSVEYVIIGGGGGGGGGYVGGGGGGGGIIYRTNQTLNSGLYTVTVGDGGNGGSHGNIGNNGSNSTFNSLTGIGGGGGGVYLGSNIQNGSNGGCGGGGAWSSGVGGSGSQGFAGSNYGNNPNRGGGGGGMGAVGTNGDPPHGGVGLTYSISGTSKYYSGGGGGGSDNVGGNNGNLTFDSNAGGRGGSGGGSASSGTNGATNTGNGGGGGGGNASPLVGGNGGSGIVIISYPYVITYTTAYETTALSVAWSANGPSYITENRNITGFTRVNIRMEMQYSTTLYYAEVEFDKISGYDSSSLYSLPQRTSPWNGYMPGINVNNMTLTTNLAQLTLPTSGLTGKLEWWPSDYSIGTNGIYDYEDTGFSQIAGYGSFQIHGFGNGSWQTIMAWNQHTAVIQDVGLGSNNGSHPFPSANRSHPDWTFSNNSNNFSNFKITIKMK